MNRCAIGEHGTPASPQEAGVIHQALRQALCERFGHETGTRIPLLYGGSVTLQNAVELLRQQEINGLFIGRAAGRARLLRHCSTRYTGIYFAGAVI